MHIEINQRVRLGIILVFVSVVASVFFFRSQSNILAENDNILDELKSYRAWKKITKNPIEVRFAEVYNSKQEKLPTDSPSSFTIDSVDGGG